MSHRSAKRRGGGFSQGPAFVSAGNLVIQPNSQAGGPDCLAMSRPGTLSMGSYKGLPGMSGGRYGMSLSDSILDPSRGIVGASAQAVRIPCESSTQNPLNLRGGRRRRRRGGAFPAIDVGKAAGLAAYHTPTAGYGNQMAGAGGVPLMLQVPYAAKSCISGGTRRRTHRRPTHRRPTHRRPTHRRTHRRPTRRQKGHKKTRRRQ